METADPTLPARPGLPALVAALRPHQWVKNLLLLVPLFSAHAFGRAEAWLTIALAFAAFCFVASATYIVNDLVDREADRQHPRKRLRPFASGALSPRTGVAVAIVLLLLGALAAWRLPPLFALCLGSYFALTLAYTLKLKRVAMLDVVLLASLYTLRVIAGNSALALELSFWLLAFSMFMFASLALIKRCAELVALRAASRNAAAGRDYTVEDLPVVLALGAASGYLAVLVLALYINSDASRALYHAPVALWLFCPMLLYWISRVWLITWRGAMHDDPILFAVRDRVSLVLAAIGVAVLYVAL